MRRQVYLHCFVFTFLLFPLTALWSLPAFAAIDCPQCSNARCVTSRPPVAADSVSLNPSTGTITQLALRLMQSVNVPDGFVANVTANATAGGSRHLSAVQNHWGLPLYSVVALLAAAWLITARYSWWRKCLIAIAVPPIAIIADAARIATVACLEQSFSATVDPTVGESFLQDATGWAAIALAVALLGLVLWCLKLQRRQDRAVGVGDLIHFDASRRPTLESSRRLTSPVQES